MKSVSAKVGNLIFSSIVFAILFLVLAASTPDAFVQREELPNAPSSQDAGAAASFPLATAALTATVTPLPFTRTNILSATADIGNIQTEVAGTVWEEAFATAVARSLTFNPTMTNTPENTPDIAATITEAIQIYETGVSLTETAIPQTNTPDTILNEQGYWVKRIGADQSRMVRIDTGDFLFWIDQTEATFAQYRHCVENGGCSPLTRENNSSETNHAESPVVFVNWFQAADYCAWAGKQLPTNDLWSIAAGYDGEHDERSKRKYPWGNETPSERLLNADRTINQPSLVGSYPSGASPFGVLDLAGNVWEWTADESILIRNGAMTTTRIIRGGSWRTAYNELTILLSGEMAPDERADDVGFRCVYIPD